MGPASPNQRKPDDTAAEIPPCLKRVRVKCCPLHVVRRVHRTIRHHRQNGGLATPTLFKLKATHMPFITLKACGFSSPQHYVTLAPILLQKSFDACFLNSSSTAAGDLLNFHSLLRASRPIDANRAILGSCSKSNTPARLTPETVDPNHAASPSFVKGFEQVLNRAFGRCEIASRSLARIPLGWNTREESTSKQKHRAFSSEVGTGSR
jgi:hypothetical protein